MRPQQKLDIIQAAEHEPKNHHQALAFPLPVMILLCRAAHSDPRRLEGHPRVGPWRERRQRQRQLRRRQGENARGSWAAAQHQGADQQHQRQLQRDMGQVLKMKRITKRI